MALLPLQHALASGAPSSTEGSGATATVVNVVPQAGRVSAARTTSVLANFSSALDPATVTSANVKLFGSMSGALPGTITTPATTQIFIQPTTPFVRGETVTVTLGSGIQTTGGQAITPYQWSFTVAAEGSTGIFGTEQRIQSGDSGADNMTTGDVDGDGDIDLVGSPPGGGLAWYANDGVASFTPRTLSSTDAADLKVVDLNGDGRLDVLVAGGDAVTWYRNDGGGTPAFTAVQVASAARMTSVSVADMDGDGDLDVISGARNAFTKVGWSENHGGVFGTRQAIANDGTGAGVRRVEAADMDGDGDGDVVASWLDRDEVVLYENRGVTGFIAHVVSSDPRVFALEIADVDQDGALDIVAGSGENSTITGYRNQGGNVFSSVFTIANAPVTDLQAVDIDADGDLDLVAALGNIGGFSLALYTNAGGTSFTRTALNGASSASANGVAAADLDADGDLDIAASFGFGFISWFGQEPNTFTIEATVPAQAALGVARGDNISATFSSSVDPLTVVSNVVVRGSQSGVMVGNFSFPNSRTIVFNPINDFLPGEQVHVTLASGLQGANGMAATPHTWSFSAASNAGPGTFSTQQVISTQADGAYSVYAADVDRDGDVDVLSASRSDHKIAWYENDGSGGFGVQQVISTQALGPQSVHAADVDGDGDVDVLSASFLDDMIAWYENDGSGSFGTQQVISTQADGAFSVYAADVDGDGDVDVLSASRSDHKIAWYENDGSGGFGVQQVISTQALGPQSVYAVDVDGDGDMDVLSASVLDDEIAWYENDGSGGFGTQQVISTQADFAQSVYAADVDGDGDVDVLSASSDDNKIAWYENDGSGSFGAQQVISTQVSLAVSVYAADVDGDGDVDVLSASVFDSKIAWYENNGSGSFGTQQVISTQANGAQSVYATDLDGDGDLDVLSASVNDDTIAWYEQATPSFSVTSTTPDGNPVGVARDANVTATFAADVDQGTVSTSTFTVRGSLRGEYAGSFTYPTATQLQFDPAQDFLPGEVVTVVASPSISSSGGTALSEYQWSFRAAPERGAGAHTERIISTTVDAAAAVRAVDVDGDGDLDVLAAATFDNAVLWYENDGSQGFTQRVITSSASSVSAIYAADVDSDGDMDVLSGAFSGSQVTWYENDGSQSFTTHVVAIRSGVFGVFAADVDSDGDIDLLSASLGDSSIVWYENDGSQGFTAHVITDTALGARSVYAIDVDGDGDVDVLSASRTDNTIAWYENDGSQRFTKRTVTTAADAAFAVYAADVDGDGDVDVLSASSDDHKVAWHENDGSQGFTERVLPTTAFNARSVYAADADGDGDMDVLAAAGNTIAWYENDGSQGFTERILTTQAFNAASVHAADVDGDGDLDVLSASGNDDTIAWYEQALPTATIGGDAGWRMLSAPAATFTPNDLADDTAIQGITGGANPADAPNLYTRPSTEAWTAPTSISTALTPGLGFILYFYANTLQGSQELPLTLDADGLPPTTDVTASVASGGFTLLGNPYAHPIALDQLSGNGTGGTGTGLVSPIQVWDDGTGTPAAGDQASTTGSFQTFNLGENQIIAPWQGFMLQSADATEATIPLAARSGSTATIEIFQRPTDDAAGDSLAVPNDEPAFRRIAFELAGPEGSGALDASAQLYFHAEASTGRDGYDGRKLVPLLGQYATLAFAAPDGGEELLVQDARSLHPVEVERYELAVSIAGLSGSFTLRWPQWEAIPEGWRIELRDRITGDVVDLRESEQYVFESAATTASASKLGAGVRMRAQTAGEAERRFELVVVSDAVLTSVGDVFEVPDRVALLPSYPNPFNPSTTLGFALPVAGRAAVSVYNALGQRVAVVADGVYGAGRHEVVWEASGLPSGVYVVRLAVGDQVQTRTVTLLK